MKAHIRAVMLACQRAHSYDAMHEEFMDEAQSMLKWAPFVVMGRSEVILPAHVNALETKDWDACVIDCDNDLWLVGTRQQCEESVEAMDFILARLVMTKGTKAERL